MEEYSVFVYLCYADKKFKKCMQNFFLGNFLFEKKNRFAVEEKKSFGAFSILPENFLLSPSKKC